MGWLIAAILAVVLVLTRRRLREAERAARHFARRPLDAGPGPGLSYSDALDLTVLRLEIDRLRDSGALDEERHGALHEAADALWSERLLGLEEQPGTEAWRVRCARAWALLMRRGADGPAPWAEAHLPVQTNAVELEPRPDPAPTPALGALAELSMASPSKEATNAADMPSPEPSGNLAGVTAPSQTDAISCYAWQPAAPGLLARTLKTVSGWHALLAPFLVQNIGWFIGGFCFLAGSIFLVSYTTGFAKALAIFGALAAYTLLLLHGGYQLLRRRPELSTSSQVLVSLGALLVPLTIAAATRLLATAAPSYGLL
ncbi:MAG: hypothetical protein L0210_02625, partial [Rhodospirillales bacterium]|nr:hypothetical protein [Rhodospirillales bacterium]